MGSTLYFLETPGDVSEVVAWFRARPAPPVENRAPSNLVLYFREFGPLVLDREGSPDASRSPIITIYPPEIRRGLLWTVGEIHFLSTLSLDGNKPIRTLARSFSRWLKAHEQVYDLSSTAANEYGYFLEGSAKSRGPIYALPSGIERLKRGGYFVSQEDNDVVLERVCRALRLRGLRCDGSPS